MYLHNEASILQRLVEDTAEAFGIEKNYVYKDYFVCMALKEMVAANPALVFKGGTALSKCYDIINRFSEDIDLGLESTKPSEGMRKKTKEAVKHAIDKLGLAIDNLDDTRSRREFNQYRIKLPMLTNDSPHDVLIIETGLMTSASPSQCGDLMSFIGEYLVNEERQDIIVQFELERFNVNVVLLERAFVDKTFALADYYLNGEILYRQSRHLYDLFKLERAVIFDKSLANLFTYVRSERKGKIKCSSASPGVSLKVVLQEILDKQVYRNDYETVTMPLLYEEVIYNTAASVLPRIINFLDS